MIGIDPEAALEILDARDFCEAIDVALALGYIEAVDGEIQRSLEAVRRVLVSVVV